MKSFIKLSFFLCFLSYSCLFAQELPPVTNFSPKIYTGEKQNWAISQDKEKTIYIANNRGLLSYNGASWRLYDSPNETIIRSVKVINDKVFTGCYMEFGYWEKNELDELEYTSLSKEIRDQLIEDEQFWNILSFENMVVFQSLNRIYIYDLTNRSFNILGSNESITKTYQTQNTIYFQKSNQGLFKIEEGRELLVSDDNILKENRVINVFQKNEDVLVLIENKGFFKLSNKELKEWQTSLNLELNTVNVYNAIQLKNGNFALGTIANGFILLDTKGSLLYQLNREKGLNNNTVLSLYEDIDEDIWLGLDNGISLVNEESPFTLFNDFIGDLGSIYASAIFKEYLYLGTNQGLFFKKMNSSDEFKLIQGTKGQVWSLKVIDETLFCGHNLGTFAVNSGKITLVSTIEGTWDFKKINDSLVLQGNYDGLYVLKKDNENWSLRNKIEGFNISSKQFEIFKSTKIFVNHEYKGVYELKVDKDFTSTFKIKKDTVNLGVHSSIASFQNKIYLAYKKGIFEYNEENASFVRDTSLSNIYKDDFISGKLVIQDNEMWAFAQSSLAQITPSKLSNGFEVKKIPLDNIKRNSVVGYENILKIVKNQYLLCSSSGYIVINTAKLPQKEFEVTLNKVSLKGNKIDHEVNGVFKNHQNNLTFTYNVAEFDKFFLPEYQYRLEGLEKEWSKWSTNYSKTFESLPNGNYTFLVRGRVGSMLSKNEASYSFEIKKPWYASNFMLVIYVISFVLFSIAMHMMYRRYYKKQQRRIIQENQKELKIAQIENEKEIIKIRNEKLRKDFKDKSKELASSIMSVVKKNELLTSIKNQIVSVDNGQLKAVIKLIDQNLKDNDDWEFFQEAFNNADSEFLQRLKKLHPNLSPNDLKLCAYLRLNLSSKEIAPLFNISVRSVEIKRYRLRKKMNLQHENNLVDYILNL
ncbi:helix-turn-helix and ligand-binding sensor domain-containing protein [Tenacibaculum aiptasiae]|uniref:helix-turn-helix and ligand-binding sensor domain-containing protein n=1 Tax=Tenacibaculum aiptasiae TaxID=426481 RepID=UPI00232B8930|nr:triple tyrosine motif-containing protein [Tenacibaculum aiptasiae]